MVDKIYWLLEIGISIVSAVACATVIQELFTHRKFFRRIFTEEDNQGSHLAGFEMPYFGVVTYLELTAYVIGMVISFSWLITLNWMLNNILAFCLCFMFLKSMRLNKLVPGILLLSLLFFYDIFWVFGSRRFTKNNQSVMLKVATGFDAPIKFLMPQLLWFIDRPRNRCSLLGLGDIVIPGLFIGFCIRFGRYISKTKNADPTKSSYVCPLLTAYTIALFICGFCLIVFESA